MNNKQIKHVASYHVGHPNPQKYRKQYTLLNGIWKFVFDQEDKGLDLGYQIDFPKEHLPIDVPYAYQCEKSGINLPEKQCDVVWYEKEFEITDTSLVNIITFLSIDYLATVFVNGKYVMIHEGGYDIFKVDLTDYAICGKNKITLRIEDTMHIDQIRGKQRWRRDSFTCFYPEASGIVRDVYLESLNTSHISDFSFKADYLSKLLSVKLQATTQKDTELQIIVTESDGRIMSDDTFEITKEGNYVINYEEIKGWSYDNPYLYNVVLKLHCNGQLMDEIYSYVGFTSVRIQDKHFYINGKDTYLKFVLDQGYYGGTLTTPTEQQIINDTQLMMDCGFNGARKHEHTPSPLTFYYMDLYGLYVWQECPSAHGYSYYANLQYRKQYPRIIQDHISHPCIIGYVIFNESWGINEISESMEIQDMTVEMYNSIKRQVGDRIVISNDGWEHTISDIITFHNYAETYDALVKELQENLLAMYNGENTECILNWKRFFAGNYRYKEQPVMHSEFAGICMNVDKQEGWGYGKSVEDSNGFLNKYADQLLFILEHEEIRGLCMTQLSDVFQEKNGIVTMDRRIKVDPLRLKELHNRFK